MGRGVPTGGGAFRHCQWLTKHKQRERAAACESAESTVQPVQQGMCAAAVATTRGRFCGGGFYSVRLARRRRVASPDLTEC